VAGRADGAQPGRELSPAQAGCVVCQLRAAPLPDRAGADPLERVCTTYHQLRHYFNSSLLTALVDAKQQRGDLEAVARLKTVSPVAWQHINFAGRYEFHTADETINPDDLIKNLS